MEAHARQPPAPIPLLFLLPLPSPPPPPFKHRSPPPLQPGFPLRLWLPRAGDERQRLSLLFGAVLAPLSGPREGTRQKGNQRLSTFISPLICQFCHEIPLQRA